MFRTVLFVDEVHRWSKAQQDVLLPAVEHGTVTLIGATTENPYFSLVTPLLSRTLLLRLEPLSAEDLRTLLRRALDDADRGLGKLGLTVTDEALDHLAEISGGDARLALTGLEAAALGIEAEGGTEITRDRAAEAVQKKAVVYDRQGDAHYDVMSAFIKSIRGSDRGCDPVLAREDARSRGGRPFIARRMIVHASEDVGLADPRALLIAVAAAHAVEHVGLPEARLNLAEAAIYLARAPKSNSVYTALSAATRTRSRPTPSRAPARRELPGSQELGHGDGLSIPARLPRAPGRSGVPPGSLPGEPLLRAIG